MTIRDKFRLGERFTFAFPSKEDVDAKTFEAIMQYVERQCGYRCSDIVGSAWNDPDNRYPGTLPKRISKWLYRNKHVKLTETMVKTIGDMARANMVKSDTYSFDFDDKLNWEPGDFGDRYSCFMGHQEGGVMDVLRYHKSLAARFYQDNKGIARSWILFPGEKDNFYPPGWRDVAVMCNAYNSAQGLTLSKQAQIVAAFLGLGLKEVTAENQGGDYFYTNSCDNYMLGEPDIIAPITRIVLRWANYPPVDCAMCGKEYEEGNMYNIAQGKVCPPCFKAHAKMCAACGSYHLKKEMVEDNGYIYCKKCAAYLEECSICHKRRHRDVMLHSKVGKVQELVIHCPEHYVWLCEYPGGLEGSCEHARFVMEQPCHHYHWDKQNGLKRNEEEWAKIPAGYREKVKKSPLSLGYDTYTISAADFKWEIGREEK